MLSSTEVLTLTHSYSNNVAFLASLCDNTIVHEWKTRDRSVCVSVSVCVCVCMCTHLK